MSTNFKNKILLAGFLLAMFNANSQVVTIELPRQGTGINSTGPSTADVGAISMVKDPDNVGANFTALVGSEITNVTFKLINQQYTGLGYTGLSTGLTFGAGPTTAVALSPQLPGQQTVDPVNIYQSLGAFNVAPGGPTNGFYSSHPQVNFGTGIVTGATAGPTAKQNGAVTIFTAAQVQYDQGIQNNPAPVPSVFNSTTKYYYGDLVIDFNRFVKDPVIHIAGLGGSYFYLPIGVSPASDPNNWKRTRFTTELEGGYSFTALSGNSNFVVSPGKISNGAAKPDGASVSTTTSASDPFDHLGAASGSVRINGTVKTIVLKVYLRGSDITDAVREFAWSAPGTASNNDPATLRNPLTGDVWLISVSSEPASLIPLPATGVNLSASLVNSDVTLKWKTLTEINSNHFDIERSTDGINFVKIGERAAAGNSATDINYTYPDNMNVAVYYYRLKLVDMDGKITYSNIAKVNKGTVKTIRTFPNPAVDNLNIEFSNAKGSYTISLLNQVGQEVKAVKADITNTTQYVRIERNTVAAGMYYVRVKENSTGEVILKKL
jgi:Secretion system C-terminal sorting domain